jgi:hypothetical protein
MRINDDSAAGCLGGRVNAAGRRGALLRRHQAGSDEQNECEIHATKFYRCPETS